jgi:hypothetical protein
MPQKRLLPVEDQDTDVQQITEALAKIRDPMAKYFFAMFVDLMAERVAALVDANEVKPRLSPRMSTVKRAVGEPMRERVAG